MPYAVDHILTAYAVDHIAVGAMDDSRPVAWRGLWDRSFNPVLKVSCRKATMKSFAELLTEPPRGRMVPDFILKRAAELAAHSSQSSSFGPDTAARSNVKQRLRDALGMDRIEQAQKLSLIDRIATDCFDVEKIVYQAARGLQVPALLYLPHGKGPHPAVVHPPGHWMEDAKLAADIQSFNQYLVSNGIAVLCYDTLGQGERRIGWHQHGQLAPLLVGLTSLGLMVNDSLAGIDLLDERDDIDSSRIGIVGASGGGFSSIFATVLDERISVAAIACMVNTHLSQIRDAAFGTGWIAGLTYVISYLLCAPSEPLVKSFPVSRQGSFSWPTPLRILDSLLAEREK